MHEKKFRLAMTFILIATLVAFLAIPPIQAGGSEEKPTANKSRRTDWMHQAKVGMSTHYIGRRNNLEKRAEDFQPAKVAEQVSQAGAGWFLFTIHHQPWAMLAPNATYDEILGNGDFTAERDVALELAKALEKRDVRLMLYVNLRLDPDSACPEEIRTAMGGWPPSDELIENVATVYREFSSRYGEMVAGWWVDGVWMKEYKKSPRREEWFAILADALRAGNSETVIAFNQGLTKNHGMIRYGESDYTAGETAKPWFTPENRWIDGAQCHVWTYLGDFWSLSGLRFEDEEICNYVQELAGSGGVLTLEVGTQGKAERRADVGSDSKSSVGIIDPRQVQQAGKIVRAAREAVRLE